MRGFRDVEFDLGNDSQWSDSERVDLPEGARVLVTLLPDEEAGFWSGASENSIAAIWDNTVDDVYAQLLHQ